MNVRVEPDAERVPRSEEEMKEEAGRYIKAFQTVVYNCLLYKRCSPSVSFCSFDTM